MLFPQPQFGNWRLGAYESITIDGLILKETFPLVKAFFSFACARRRPGWSQLHESSLSSSKWSAHLNRVKYPRPCVSNWRIALLRRLIFSLWYLFSPPWDTGESPPELLEHLRTHPPGRALDLGCGTGTNVLTMAKRGWEVVGVDFAPTAITQAKRKARRAGVTADLRVADVTQLEGIQGPFDLILDMGCFHSLTEADYPTYADQVARLLAEGGTFLLYVFFHQGEDGPGITNADLRVFDSLDLQQRVEGTERGLRPSAWLTYQKHG